MRTLSGGSAMSSRRSSLVFSAAFALFVLAGAGRASAQDGGVVAPTAAPVAEPAPAPPPPPPTGGASDHSMRAVCQTELANDHDFAKIVCEGELAKDQAWFNDLKGRLADQLNRNVHAEAAHYATTNNKHVVAAYAVFWVLTVGFVLMMWRRQRALQGEITRLERDLAKAMKDGGAA